jgi:hypothetical protein
MITRGAEVIHNTEPQDEKRTQHYQPKKTPTYYLSRNARNNPDTQNLATPPELLLLAGGYPLW